MSDLEKLQQQVSAIETNMNYGFGELSTEIKHLTKFVERQGQRPHIVAPRWVTSLVTMLAIPNMIIAISVLLIALRLRM